MFRLHIIYVFIFYTVSFGWYFSITFVVLSQDDELFIIIIIIIIPWEFFTPALADDLLIESEWQHVFISLQDSSQYSGCS